MPITSLRITKRSYRILFATACISLASSILLLGFSRFSNYRMKDVLEETTVILSLPLGHSESGKNSSEDSGKPSSTDSEPSNAHELAAPDKNGNSTSFEMAPTYINTIMNSNDDYPRLACPVLSSARYSYLGNNISTTSTSQLPKYFFALDLYQAAHVLPRLLGSVVEAIRFLGPHNCVLSIVEGRSTDGTFEILKLLEKDLKTAEITFYFNTSEIDPWARNGDRTNRIDRLAKLRNESLRPMIDYPEKYSPDTTVLFLNDVSICTEDILELIHQRIFQAADMTCGMDWVYVGNDPTFYDVWVARGMNGDSYFEIPKDGNWNSAWNLFWNDDKSRDRLQAHKPFQVFSCWNGATAFAAKPLLEHKIAFRGPSKKECFQGEPQLFAKDMWSAGYGKIAVVPSISLEYSDKQAEKIKKLKGYTSEWTSKEETDHALLKIEWESTPPAKVKCMTNYGNQTWVPWNESLPL